MLQWQRCSQTAFAAEMAGRIVAAKIDHQRHLLQRVARAGQGDSLEVLRKLAVLREQACSGRIRDLDSLRGLEGAAAALYFPLFAASLRETFGFQRRDRRPPPDMLNALMSFGYYNLTHVVRSAVLTTGLDPAAGFLHAVADRKEALVLDLMEEFRPLIVDQAIKALVNREQVRESDIGPERRGGVALGKETIRALVRQIDSRLETSVIDAKTGDRSTYADLLVRQVQSVARSILDGHICYSGVDVR